MDIPYIRPKLLVRENDPVRTGTPLFCDKRSPDIQYVAPAAGIVHKISFGKRRKLKEIIIIPGNQEDFIQFEPMDESSMESSDKIRISTLLKKAGLWQGLREFPFRDTADDTHEPSMIIVSLNGNDIFSPVPHVLLENRSRFLEYGIKILKKFSDRIIISARKSDIDRSDLVKKHATHAVGDLYPAWDPGVVLYHLKTSAQENNSWCINAEHLILIAKFLLTGRYPSERLVSVTGLKNRNCHIITRQGAPIGYLAGQCKDGCIISTGRFNGRQVQNSSHLGFFENTLNIIKAGPEEKFMGFLRPGPEEPDCNRHGEERACINCGFCTEICPVDLEPGFIMKALLGDDIEEALEYGLLDCCRCGLCSYACPSKIELVHLLSEGINVYYKDRQ